MPRAKPPIKDPVVVYDAAASAWWAPRGDGYVQDPANAGRYERADAEGRVKVANEAAGGQGSLAVQAAPA